MTSLEMSWIFCKDSSSKRLTSTPASLNTCRPSMACFSVKDKDHNMVASAAMRRFSWVSGERLSQSSWMIITPKVEDDWCQPGVEQYLVTWCEPADTSTLRCVRSASSNTPRYVARHI